jgi:hypothetical protein
MGVLAASVACTSNKATPGPVASTCTPDPALIAQGRTCRSDDQCPCGAHCALGVCGADCSATDACPSGQRCDQFGRCRQPEDPGLVAPVATVAQGTIQLETTSLLVPGDAGAMLRFTATDHNLSAVRLQASAGYALQCGADAGWQSSCAESGLALGGEIAVPVRAVSAAAADAGAAGSTGSVAVFSGGSVQTVALSAPGGTAVVSSGLAGAYSGTATLASVTLTQPTLPTAPSATPGLASPSIAIPVTAQVFAANGASAGVLVLTDPLQAFSPTGSWIGALSVASPTAGSVTFPKILVEGGPVTAALKSEILAGASAAPYVLSASGQTLSIAMDVDFQGLGLGARVPDAHWQITLQKTGALAAGATAPVVPADATPTLPSTAATTASDWSQAQLGLYETFSSGSVPQEQQEVLATWQATSGDPTTTVRRVDACAPGARLVAGTAARADEWQGSTFFPPSPTSASQVSMPSTGKVALLGEVLSQVTTNFVVYASAAPTPPPTGDPPLPAPDGSIPCAVSFQPSDVYCYDGTNNTSLLQLPSMDRCADIAAELKCNVQTTDGGPFDFDLTLNTAPTMAGTPPCGDPTTQPPNLIRGEVTKVCVLPPVAWNCGDLVECTQSDGRTSYSPSTPLAVSGDLLCGSGAAPVPVTGDAGAATVQPPANDSLATVADWNRNQPANTDSVSTVVDNVLSDFSRLTGAPAAPFPTPLAFDAPRQLVALEYATEVDRERATTNTALPASPGATRSAGRLLQQWATIQALVAHEASQRAQVSNMVTGLPPDPLAPSPANALTDSLNEWALFLHPRFATAISALDGASLIRPDYRADWNVAASTDPNATEGDGLPTAVLDALNAQFTLLDVVAYQGALAGDATVLPLVGRTVRDAILMQALARDLYARVVAANGGAAPPWGAKFLQSDQALGGVARSAVNVAAAMALGKNPLGIEDSDLPLYFQGGTVDPTAEFSAISDYLLGSGSTTNPMAWAPLAVAQAQTAGGAVGAAVQAQETRQYEQALSTTDAENQLDQIRTTAGDALSNLCGLPANLTPLTAIEGWSNFNANTCYVRTELPGCAVDQAAADAQLDPPSVLYQFCVAAQLAMASSTVTYQADDLESALSAQVTTSVPCTFGVGLCAAPVPLVGCLSCMGGTVVTNDLTVARLAGLNLSGVTSDMVSAAQATCIAQYPTARQTLPSIDGPDGPLGNPACLNGSIGDSALTLRSANQNIQIALSQMQDHLDAYDIEMNNCFIQVASNATLQALEASHVSDMEQLRATKAADDSNADIAQAVYNCAMAVTTAAGANTAAAGVAIAGAAVGCGAASAEAAFQTESIDTQEAMDNADSVYQQEVDTIQEDATVAQCMNEAHQELVGMRTAEQQVEAAYLDFDHAQYDLTQGVASAQQVFSQAAQQIATAEARTLRPPALDPWADQRLTDYAAAMSQARRVTYLAERAVEYEYQASLTDRATILSAQTPDQLASVLEDLHNTSGTLGINGNRPSNLKVILSLRDQLLQLYDASHIPANEQTLSPSDRFKVLLRDPRFAVYSSGTYAGQSIPFSLAPLGALNGNALGIPVLSSTDCAERVWSVNASIEGSQALERGSATTFARVDLLKKNTFFSQWCGTPPQGSTAGTQFQVASVNPSHNLFLDPMYGPSVQGSATGVAPSDSVPSEIALDSRARIQAYFNIPQATFEEDSYENGETSELAARGLYGDYALFFSSDVLSLPQVDANGAITGYTDGLDLTQIDDILLRIDYVSVAQ